MERTVDVAWGEHGLRALVTTCDVLAIDLDADAVAPRLRDGAYSA